MTAPPPWSTALPNSAAHAALAMLAAGESRPATARALSISLRQLVNYLSPLRQRLGATTPYTLGMLAVRSGCLDPATVVDGPQQRRAEEDWTLPTTDQREILRLLAAGHTYEKIAAALGEGTRTVQRRFWALSAANGVSGLLPAGALFEALGWHHRP